jgi:hypothetical protein
MNNTSIFDEQHLLHALRHYLPSQTPLKDFIHHNSLHAFQEMKFFDAILKHLLFLGIKLQCRCTTSEACIALEELMMLFWVELLQIEKVLRQLKHGNQIVCINNTMK